MPKNQMSVIPPDPGDDLKRHSERSGSILTQCVDALLTRLVDETPAGGNWLAARDQVRRLPHPGLHRCADATGDGGESARDSGKGPRQTTMARRNDQGPDRLDGIRVTRFFRQLAQGNQRGQVAVGKKIAFGRVQPPTGLAKILERRP